MFVDSHCHLDFPELATQLDQVVAKMRSMNVTHALSVGVNPADYPTLCTLIAPYGHIFSSVGLHPEERSAKETTIDQLIACAATPKTVAIGETGLDYYHVPEKAEWQRQRFRVHIRAAKQIKKPLIIHMRDATEDTLRILREERADEVGGVMHCFTGDWTAAEKALSLGFYISFSGIVTFKNARETREAAQRVPLERLLIETDSPFLTPVPHRGKYPNEPAWIAHVAEEIARLRDMPVEDIGRITAENFFRLFSTDS
ncbi:MAG: TatD family hydrolase [Burkholderiales bacterium]|jgi:TatD DNase family protein|nr:TatD family hydrolase [Burkholderiales bacterium]